MPEHALQCTNRREARTLSTEDCVGPLLDASAPKTALVSAHWNQSARTRTVIYVPAMAPAIGCLRPYNLRRQTLTQVAGTLARTKPFRCAEWSSVAPGPQVVPHRFSFFCWALRSLPAFVTGSIYSLARVIIALVVVQTAFGKKCKYLKIRDLDASGIWRYRCQCTIKHFAAKKLSYG